MDATIRITDRGTMARTFAALFAVGGGLGLLSLALPAPPGREPLGVLLPAVLACLMALAFALAGRRLPGWAYAAAPALGTLMVVAAAHWGGTGAAGAYAMLLFWVVLAAVIVLDLDRFKALNDELGHQAGDEALLRVGRVLRDRARAMDTIARLGGEEFALLLPRVRDAEAYEVAERLRRAIATEFADSRPPITASCAIACFPEHGLTSGALIRRADRALYAAKDLGRNRSVIGDLEIPAGEPGGGGDGRERLARLLSFAEEVNRRKGGVGDIWRAGLYAESLARALGLPEARVERIRLAAALRGVGEVFIPSAILESAAPLTDLQWRAIQMHPEAGARMAAEAELEDVSAWVRCHHERLDGRGYPEGLSGEAIPLEARILALASAYAAMRSTRPYRRALPPRDAQERLRSAAGSQLDSELVERFLRLVGEEGGELRRPARLEPSAG